MVWRDGKSEKSTYTSWSITKVINESSGCENYKNSLLDISSINSRFNTGMWFRKLCETSNFTIPYGRSCNLYNLQCESINDYKLIYLHRYSVRAIYPCRLIIVMSLQNGHFSKIEALLIEVTFCFIYWEYIL